MRKSYAISAILVAFSLGVAVPRHWFVPPLDAMASAVEVWQSGRIPEGSVVMLGDSITAMGDFSPKAADGRELINAGQPGETVSRIAKRASEIARAKPYAVFVMAGVNDLLDGADPADVRNDYAALLGTLSAVPNLYVQSTLLTSMPDPKLNERIVELDKMLSAMCGGTKNCTYLDLNRIFAPNGVLLYPRDGLHLHPSAYARWQSIVTDALRRASSQGQTFRPIVFSAPRSAPQPCLAPRQDCD